MLNLLTTKYQNFVSVLLQYPSWRKVSTSKQTFDWTKFDFSSSFLERLFLGFLMDIHYFDLTNFLKCKRWFFDMESYLKIVLFKLSKCSFSKLSKYSFPSCQNFLSQTVKIFLFQTVKIFLSKLPNFPFPNCQNFPFQAVKIFFLKLSKFSFSNTALLQESFAQQK
jgi:hypothetical protein